MLSLIYLLNFQTPIHVISKINKEKALKAHYYLR